MHYNNFGPGTEYDNNRLQRIAAQKDIRIDELMRQVNAQNFVIEKLRADIERLTAQVGK